MPSERELDQERQIPYLTLPYLAPASTRADYLIKINNLYFPIQRGSLWERPSVLLSIKHLSI